MSAKRVRKIERNRGGYLLGRQGLKNTDIAAKLGISPTRVGQLIKGQCGKPDEALRLVISNAFPIPVTAWDESPRSRKPTGNKATEAVDAPSEATASIPIPAGVQSRAAFLETYLEGLLKGLVSDPDSTPAEQLDIIGKAAGILEKLGKTTGEHANDLKKLLALPDFKKATETISEAVKPCKDGCPERVAKALRKVEGQ